MKNRKPYSLTAIACIIAAFSTTLYGQIEIVVPSSLAEEEADASITNIASSYHSQQVYSASDFAGLPPGESLLVRADWRPDGFLTAPETYTAERWIMKYSTTTKEPNELDLEFAKNVGTDEVVVYDGPGTITTQNLGPVGGPKLIEYGIDFQFSFPYDPSKGNLLWDLTIIGGSAPLTLDWALQSDGLASAISTGSLGADSPVADGTHWGGHVSKLTFVPEPSTFWLGLAGLSVWAFSRLRRRTQL